MPETKYMKPKIKHFFLLSRHWVSILAQKKCCEQTFGLKPCVSSNAAYKAKIVFNFTLDNVEPMLKIYTAPPPSKKGLYLLFKSAWRLVLFSKLLISMI